MNRRKKGVEGARKRDESIEYRPFPIGPQNLVTQTPKHVRSHPGKTATGFAYGISAWIRLNISTDVYTLYPVPHYA